MVSNPMYKLFRNVLKVNTFFLSNLGLLWVNIFRPSDCRLLKHDFLPIIPDFPQSTFGISPSPKPNNICYNDSKRLFVSPANGPHQRRKRKGCFLGWLSFTYENWYYTTPAPEHCGNGTLRPSKPHFDKGVWSWTSWPWMAACYAE